MSEPSVPASTFSSRPLSKRSSRSLRSSRSPEPSSRTTEETPLLSREDTDEGDEEDFQESEANTHCGTSAAESSLLRSLTGSSSFSKKPRRWSSLVALLVLCVLVTIIILLGFIAPDSIEEYAKQAAVFEPTSLTPSFTETGLRARLQGNFRLDASRVKKKPIRDLGRFGTWIAREIESEPTEVKVYLPDYGNILVGVAKVPGIKVDIRNGHTTHIDVTTDLEPGSLAAARLVANDWLAGRLGRLRVLGKTDVKLRSGIIKLGEQAIEQLQVFEGHDVPSVPQYNINKLNFHEITLPNSRKAMAADASLTVGNDYPVEFTVPPLGFTILVDNCTPSDPYIVVANATTQKLDIAPKTDVKVDVIGIVRKLPAELTSACPDSEKSPLDSLLRDYIHGEETVLYIQGSESPIQETPQWISDLISEITVPVPFRGPSFGGLLKNFSLSDVHFYLPEPFAEPDTPEAQPKISATINALVNLPEEMNFPLDVDRVRANAAIYYREKKLGDLDLHEWQKANSTRVVSDDDTKNGLLVQSIVKEAPLQITDNDLFSEVVQALLFGSENLYLVVKADVDVEIEAALGTFVVRQIPAEGVVPVKPVSGGGFESLGLQVGELQIVDTTESSITLQAQANFTNPTKYSATIPYLDINVLTNDTILGHTTAENVTVVPGFNENITVKAVWDPLTLSGREGKIVGRELISQYLSGYNTTITLKAHTRTIPSQPALGRALRRLKIELPAPKLRSPKRPGDGGEDDPDDDSVHFIVDATMHLISSTADFTLHSPLTTTTIFITDVNATAFYHEEPVGHIVYDLPFATPPGFSKTPRLPVSWSLGSVGYEAVKKALGGQLKLNATAEIGVKVGRWVQNVWYVGRGIGAQVRL